MPPDAHVAEASQHKAEQGGKSGEERNGRERHGNSGIFVYYNVKESCVARWAVLLECENFIFIFN